MGITAIEWFTAQAAHLSSFCKRWLLIDVVRGASDVIECALRPLFSPPTRQTLLFTVRRSAGNTPRFVMTEDIMSPLWKHMSHCATPIVLYNHLTTLLFTHIRSVPAGQIDRFYVLVDKLSTPNGFSAKQRDRSGIQAYATGTRVTSRGMCEPGNTKFQPLDIPRIMCTPALARTLFRFFLYYFSRDPRFRSVPLAFDFDDGMFFIDRGVVTTQPRLDYAIREADLRLVLLLLHSRHTHTCMQWSIDSDELMLAMPFAMDFTHGLFWATEFLTRDKKSFELEDWSREQTAKKFRGPPCTDSHPHVTAARKWLEEGLEGPTEGLTAPPTPRSSGIDPIPRIAPSSAASSVAFSSTHDADGSVIGRRPLTRPLTRPLALTRLAFEDESAGHVVPFEDVAYPNIPRDFPDKLPPLWFNMREASRVLRESMSIEAFTLFCLLNGSDWVKHTELFYEITADRIVEAIVQTVDVMRRNPVQSRTDFEYLLQWAWSRKMGRTKVASLAVLRAEFDEAHPNEFCRIPSTKTIHEIYLVVKERYPYWRTLQGTVNENDRDKLIRLFSALTVQESGTATDTNDDDDASPFPCPAPPELADSDIKLGRNAPTRTIVPLSPDHVPDGQPTYRVVDIPT